MSQTGDHFTNGPGYLFPLVPPIREYRKSAINYVLFGFCCSLLFVSSTGLGYKFLVDSFHLSKSFHFLGAWRIFFYDFLGPLLRLNCDWERIISFFFLAIRCCKKFIDRRIDTRPASQLVSYSSQSLNSAGRRQLTCHSRRVCQFRILVTVFFSDQQWWSCQLRR